MSMDELSMPEIDPNAYTYFIHGLPKIGKTGFLAEGNDCLFLDTERGSMHLSVYREIITDWAQFKTVARNIIKKEDKKFNKVAIDTLDRLIRYCTAYVGKKKGFEHPGDLDFGVGWTAVQDELLSVLNPLSMCPDFSLWLVSHSKEVEKKSSGGSKYTAWETTIIPNIWKLISGAVDMTFFFGFNKDRRTIFTKSSRAYYAGGRINLPETIPLAKWDGSKPVRDSAGNVVFNKEGFNKELTLGLERLLISEGGE